MSRKQWTASGTLFVMVSATFLSFPMSRYKHLYLLYRRLRFIFVLSFNLYLLYIYFTDYIDQTKGTYSREATRRTVGAPTKFEGGGREESEKACESGQTNVDIVQNVQSLDTFAHSI